MPGLMQNKTVMSTGATAGIGLITARELAGMGAQITLVSRNAAKLVTAAEQIKTQTGNPYVEYIAADLATRAGVNQTAFEFKKRHTRLDVLVNNAGALFTERQVTSDGLELTFALNHLSYFHLTMLLFETLKASAAGRVVNVTSDAHRGQTINFDDLQGEKGYNGLTAYGRSKLMNVLFTYELARKLTETNVTANALHPGFVATEFAKNNGPLYKIGMKLIGLFARSPEKGAETSIYLASSPEVRGASGKYFTDSRAVDSDPASYNKATAERLWNISLEMIA
jgi:NAD(P)-dependent dehydrogenase (short-subunit alcohol dehydrogenase family)